MRMWAQSHLCQKPQRATSMLAVAFRVSLFDPGRVPAGERGFQHSRGSMGLRCSACHESWPMLNYFGQKFKDNGYQLMNDRDAPIWQESRVLAGHVPVHAVLEPGERKQGGSRHRERAAESYDHGFQLRGAGHPERRHPGEEHFGAVRTLVDETGKFHFESANVRFDNSWAAHG